MYPYRPAAATDDPRERLADGPRRAPGALGGFIALGVLCAIALVIMVVSPIIGR